MHSPDVWRLFFVSEYKQAIVFARVNANNLYSLNHRLEDLYQLYEAILQENL